jgi:hypothetical protein
MILAQPHVTTVGKPKMLHRSDCFHPPNGTLVPAKQEHLSLPTCSHCQSAEGKS